MDWLPYIKMSWALISIIMLISSLIIWWKLRGVFNWKRSLRKEIRALNKSCEQYASPRRDATQIIIHKYEEISRSFSPELSDLNNLRQYIVSIAACYHPESGRPEYEITLGSILRCCENSLARLDRIIARPGFKRLQKVTIRNVRQAFQLYRRLSENRLVRWYFRLRRTAIWVFRARLFLLPDIFVWVSYFSSRLSLLMLTRLLMIDIYLFVGRLTISGFDLKEADTPKEDVEVIEGALEELNAIDEPEGSGEDPKIRDLRAGFTFPGILFANPSFKDWMNSLIQAAGIIAATHFPGSARPLEEAAMGPLLVRSRAWVSSFRIGENVPIAKQVYKIRLHTIFRVKDFSQAIFPKPVRVILQKVFEAYGWLKGPLRAYRVIRKSSPLNVALEVGWFAVKKATVCLVCLKTFDMACKELDMVYRQSR